MLEKGLLLLLLALWCQAQTDVSGTTKNCESVLTKADPYMSKYIGQKYSIQTHTNGGATYTYHVGICVDPNPDISDCGVVQDETFSNGSVSRSHCVGKITHSQVARSSDGVWIELTYPFGENYGSHCGGASRTARIVFLCDPNIAGMGTLDFLEENRDDDICYYLFTLASRTVCGYELSVGDILLIFAACVLFLWFVAMVIGFLYKRFLMGAKGWEQVPLLGIYRDFGNLEADGCDLVCRSRRKPVPEYKEPSFGADTDEEEERDDNLLPM